MMTATLNECWLRKSLLSQLKKYGLNPDDWKIVGHKNRGDNSVLLSNTTERGFRLQGQFQLTEKGLSLEAKLKNLRLISL